MNTHLRTPLKVVTLLSFVMGKTLLVPKFLLDFIVLLKLMVSANCS